MKNASLEKTTDEVDYLKLVYDFIHLKMFEESI